MDAIAGVQRVEVSVHPAAQQPRHIRPFGMEIKCHRQTVLVKRSMSLVYVLEIEIGGSQFV